ncbi:MAG: hypothetical protein A2340_05705 [Lentisphaerae bacterium RIFOXYB12_FULL_60_10]|nr:MAG: hypothetical protein A2269_06790 [Lentisphaerae bacterium RIFOXYA12_FULL_60_10]OGV75111.1 MAG: hypothetical protein A2340_05705 [Lentisphaerae bacterium RIFOXYB12_FULL_60_10]
MPAPQKILKLTDALQPVPRTRVYAKMRMADARHPTLDRQASFLNDQPMNLNDSKPYWELAPINIAGVERTGELLAQGRTEDARCHFISSARAVFTRRWPTTRKDRIRRLGEAIDTVRFPDLVPIAQALRRNEPDAPSRFLGYLRARPDPDMSRHILLPEAPPKQAQPVDPSTLLSFALWKAWRATGDPDLKHWMDRRIADILDPMVPASWHETSHTWIKLVFSALHHGGLNDTTLCELVCFGLDYAEFVNDFAHHIEPPQTSIGGNWIFFWALSGLTAATAFPEFRRSPALVHSMLARFDDELSKQVMPDGSMIEGVPGYHNCCLNLFGEFLTICREHGLTVPPGAHHAIRRLAATAVKWIKPDGRTPMFGDSQDDIFRNVARPIGPHVDLPEVRWALTGGKEGHPPAYTSAALDCIGYYALRNGWTPDACCLVFDGGRMGQAHFHEDKLSFELNAFGRPFIVDPGIHSYSNHWLREWLTVSQAHNLILLDGVGQCRWRQDRDLWYSPMPVGNPCDLGAEWDVVEAGFDGPYERDIGPVIQRRRIVFHKGDLPFWWITDRIEGEGSFDVAELFHFAHDIEQIEVIPGGVRTRIPGGPDLAVICLPAHPRTPPVPAQPEIRLFRGERNPTRGWVSPERNAECPAWEVHFGGMASLPLRRDFILLPWRHELPNDLQVRLDLDGQRPLFVLTCGDNRFQLEIPKHLKTIGT